MNQKNRSPFEKLVKYYNIKKRKNGESEILKFHLPAKDARQYQKNTDRVNQSRDPLRKHNSSVCHAVVLIF